MVKTYIKAKAEKNAAGPKFGTPDHFKGSIFGPGKLKPSFGKNQRFSNTSFRTQHKGG